MKMKTWTFGPAMPLCRFLPMLLLADIASSLSGYPIPAIPERLAANRGSMFGLPAGRPDPSMDIAYHGGAVEGCEEK